MAITLTTFLHTTLSIASRAAEGGDRRHLPLPLLPMARPQPQDLPAARTTHPGSVETIPTILDVSLDSNTAGALAERQVTLAVNITSHAPGARLACAPFSEDEVAPQTGGTVLSHSLAYTAEYTMAKTLNEIHVGVITNLIPGTTYDIYCYVEDALGNTMSDEDLQIQSPLVISTECCRSIDFTNRPSAVFGNVSLKYEVAGVDRTEYVFEYELETSPEDTVFVTPVITGNFSEGVTVLPASATFLNSSARNELTGTFVIICDDAYAG